MTDKDYLYEVLASQELADDSAELQELAQHRKDVETLLRRKFADSSPTIRYGGSRAKGTLIKEYYDLDIACYFPRDDADAGGTIKDIYANVRVALQDQYQVREKTSALRLQGKGTPGRDFHIDVVPGRYVNDSKTDCFLHQSNGDKERLKTNLQTHIDHISKSGVVDAIRLMKLWKVRRGLSVKQFVFELLVMKLLADRKQAALADQLLQVWKDIGGTNVAISVEDPANPQGNDLMPDLRTAWPQLSGAAALTLDTLENGGWEAIFGPLKKVSSDARVARLESAAVAVSNPTRPWFNHHERTLVRKKS